jgi:hypothetical protein
LVSLQLYSRGEAKQYLEKLFNDISNNEYVDACISLNNLKKCLLKYYLTRNVSCDEINNVFHEFEFILRNGRGTTKKNTCYDFIKKIRSTSQLTVSDPVTRLRQIYEDMRFAYLHISPENIETIIDCFDEIRDLKTKMDEIGGTINNYYTIVYRNMGECESILMDLTRIKGGRYDKNALQSVMNSFQKLFGSIQAVIAPPIRLHLTSEEIQTLGRTHSVKDIAKATGQREEEIQTMLNQIEASENSNMDEE